MTAPGDAWHGLAVWNLPAQMEGAGIKLAADLSRAFTTAGIAAFAAARWLPGPDGGGRVAIFSNPAGGLPLARDDGWATAMAASNKSRAILAQRAAVAAAAVQVIDDLRNQLVAARKTARFEVGSPSGAPPPIQVDVHVAAPQVNVEAAAPVVIPAPQVTVEAAAPLVLPAPMVNVSPGPSRREVVHERNRAGQITKSTITERAEE